GIGHTVQLVTHRRHVSPTWLYLESGYHLAQPRAVRLLLHHPSLGGWYDHRQSRLLALGRESPPPRNRPAATPRRVLSFRDSSRRTLMASAKPRKPAWAGAVL